MDDADKEIAELKERLAALEKAKAAAAPAPVVAPSPTSSGSVGLVLVVIGIAVLLGVAYAVTHTTGSESHSAYTPAGEPAWSPPPGYEIHETAEGKAVGVQWAKAKEGECIGSRGACVALIVVSKEACPRNFYASITLLDKAGQNIGWTNDSAQGVRPGEPARLVFESYTPNVVSARVAELNCY